MTAAVSHLVETGQLNPAPLLNRHLAGDWGRWTRKTGTPTREP